MSGETMESAFEKLIKERDAARKEADSRYKDWVKAVDACDLLRKAHSSLREELGRCKDHKTKIASERNEYASQINELRKENDRLQSKLAKAEADAEHHKAHADKLWEATHKELSYEPEATPERVETVNRVGVALVDFNVFEASVSRLTAERDAAQVECEKLRKDWQEMSVKFEVAEDEVHVLTERLTKEQKVVLELAEQNDLLTLELDSRRTAFLQMVVEMGKISKEMLRT